MKPLAIIAALACALSTAAAQPEVRTGPPQGRPTGPQVSVGIGLAATSQPYAGVDDRARLFPIPLITYRGSRLQFTGKTGQATLYQTRGQDIDVRVAAVADWRFQSYDADDSPILIGMDDRSGTLETGLRVGAQKGRYSASLTGLADTLSRHGGYQIDASVGADLVRSRTRGVSVNAGLRYQSSSLADYYFGVDPEEALITDALVRPAYETGDAFLPSVGVTGRQALGDKVVLFGIAQYEFLPDAITDSPIVDQSGQVFAFAGVAYNFGGR